MSAVNEAVAGRVAVVVAVAVVAKAAREPQTPRVLRLGWPVPQAAKATSVSRAMPTRSGLPTMSGPAPSRAKRRRRKHCLHRACPSHDRSISIGRSPRRRQCLRTSPYQ